jgi:uncharacterized protein
MDIKKVTFRFYAELNDFLPVKQKQQIFDHYYKGTITVKDAVESLGVPHSSIDLILVNSQPADFLQKLKIDDFVSVFPEFETFDISDINRLRKKPLRTSRFMADAHLGKLARDLRMLGFDTLFANNIPDKEIIALAAREKRTILTRDRDLLKSDHVDHGYYVRAIGTQEQLEEVISKFDLFSQFKPFTRCIVCNGKLENVELSEIQEHIKPETIATFSHFFRCAECEKIYWEGSHFMRMSEKINNLSQSFTSGNCL